MHIAPIRKIVIVGGGTAGWMAAALFAKLFLSAPNPTAEVTLVESEDIGTVGVGEATIPAIKRFNQLLDLDEADFMKATQATFKLGIEFAGWTRPGDSYIHGFGKIGQELGWLRAHQYWLKMRGTGKVSDRFDDYSINTAAAHANRFLRARPDMPQSPLNDIAYAYHFDAGLFARYLRAYSEKRGVVRAEGRITDVRLKPDTGFVDRLVLADGREIDGELFIDCSGMRALLIEKALGVGYQDWGHWLPCDRAVAVPCAYPDAGRAAAMTPCTRSTAREAGWQWRIPLQHRIGNGVVYASAFTGDDAAVSELLASLDGPALAEPRAIPFRTGKRSRVWEKNVVAVGLSSGFLEPLESTSIHLIQSTLIRLVNLFPDTAFAPTTIAQFNAMTDFDFERIRDFIIAHYRLNARDGAMWAACRDMIPPDTLRQKLDHFADRGRIVKEAEELFAEESWIQVLLGQGLIPKTYDPCVDLQTDDRIAAFLNNISGVVRACVARMPEHAEFVAAYCPADMPLKAAS